MADYLISSQESDFLPEEVKHCINNDLDMQDVINSVHTQDLFMPDQSEVQYVLQAPTPSPTCAMLCTEDYPGPYEFEVQVNGEKSGKNWQFSYNLNKLFINMGTPIHLSFKCSTFPPDLFVRAIPVFSASQYFQEPVERCVHHRIPGNKNNEGLDEMICYNVIRIEHPQAIYELDEASGRRSVRVLLNGPPAGSDCVTIPFKFMCKNSCISGMNRRATDVIFTLETYNAVVLGRQSMKVRTCSCPKRDKMKEEDDLNPKAVPHGKRLMNQKNPDFPSKKQRKTDNDNAYQTLTVVAEDYLDLVDYAHCRLSRRLRVEKREPTERERQLLNGYEQKLNSSEEHAAT